MPHRLFPESIEDALQAAHDAVRQSPDAFGARLELAGLLFLAGDVRAALAEGERIESLAGDDAQRLARAGGFHTQCGQFQAAWRCHRRAAELHPGDARLAYNAAAAAVAVGEIDVAEQGFEAVMRLDSTDYDAWQNRSTLRRWTAECNHVAQLASLYDRLPPGDPGETPVGYALAKELEDLDRFEESFAWLQRAATARRRRLDYDIASDEAALARIETVFDRDWLAGASEGPAEPGPLFIVGLPRSGTTLTDRMLSSHPGVASLGEINTLALAVTRLAGEGGDKAALIERAGALDLAELGRSYLDSSRGFGVEAPWLIDKTPLNFLYLGLIRRALPGAKVIHLRRHPVDSCYAMYKTLFRSGYPFSYSLQDTGRYYLAYHRLMGHWRRHLGDFILDVDYERLVEDPEGQVRRMLAFIGLEWDPACLDFHRQAAPAATASAAQVRQPVYTISVERWRCYERQLAPLAGKLREGGVPV